MKTLQLFSAKPETIPLSASWYIADLAEARGRQELYMRQVPRKKRGNTLKRG
jgi:hypothetical protein